MAYKDQQLRATHTGRRVQVTIPAEVAFDLDRFQSAVKNLAEELGCLPCISGADCTFSLFEDLVVNPAGEIAKRRSR